MSINNNKLQISNSEHIYMNDFDDNADRGASAVERITDSQPPGLEPSPDD